MGKFCQISTGSLPLIYVEVGFSAFPSEMFRGVWFV